MVKSPLLLDVSRLVWRLWAKKLPTGIDRTCLAYAAHFRECSQAVVQRGRFTRVLSAKASAQLYDILLEQEYDHARRRLLSLFPTSLGAAREQVEGRLYLNVGHTGLDKVGHVHWLHQTRVRPIYFVHDLIPIHYPEYCRPDEPKKHAQRVRSLLCHGAGVIANSCQTLEEVRQFAAQQSLPMPASLVAPLGLGDQRSAANGPLAVGLPERPYFVLLGTIEARKNHLLILTAWAELARRLGSECPHLVIIGQRGWECEQAIDMLDRCAAIRPYVTELSGCDDSTLAAFMRGAKALLFPSFVEGYGLPLIEALAAGTPVIASDLPVFRELAGSIPDYLNPIDGLGWIRAVEDYAQRGSRNRSAQLDRLPGWQPPSWSAHFAAVDAWLDRISQTPSSAPVLPD
ncbi:MULTISPECIES: glycosyltransferase family 4 protein [unclassified Sphingobium]|uniref:glycosyltransferase family 4 protein n=1 Tax=unclassified Sphingobium TaxID=2611147 RepID=UPI00222597A4|nr:MULTISPECIES: glycosyltransferase family 1 protein [unclassified Sphingobium]MCW2411761.1 glycosyltransferase involved in cell wall biosynthesis [Sphingobium sp. B8D3D]MCW2415942.1 glycosyltransferase involved in cell wall biosynthesis [Sphingobium sp. B8D3A]